MPHPKGLYPRLESPGGPTSKVSDDLIFEPLLGVREGESKFLFFIKARVDPPQNTKKNPIDKEKIERRMQTGTPLGANFGPPE
jgi:hypothetical protein